VLDGGNGLGDGVIAGGRRKSGWRDMVLKLDVIKAGAVRDVKPDVVWRAATLM